MIMAHLQSRSDFRTIPPKVLPDSLADRLQGFEAIPLLGRMDARTFKGTVADPDEDKNRSFLHRDRGRGIRSPHLIGDFCDDGTIVPEVPV